MPDISIGTPLSYVVGVINENNILPEYKEKIVNFCRQELSTGDSLISNELELAMLKAWLNNTDNVKMPEISDKFKLVKEFTDNSNDFIKVFEKYKYTDGTYYIKCTTKNKEGKILKTQLAHRNSSVEEMLKGNCREDILFDNNNDGNADSRLVSREIQDSDSGYKININFDTNLAGKFE